MLHTHRTMIAPPTYSYTEWYIERFRTLLAARFLKPKDIVYLSVLGTLGYLFASQLIKELRSLLVFSLGSRLLTKE
ncbi:Hypothetical protein DHA2_153661 [Giardia duodenalis]|uniref:Uncharacterized protein n=1 Tax=Giardia intestinalis TaxID=5741 RepID=V6T8T4_GIAIN|nr:Hypothetical protein DHA2_153661 [Giardia intestinalis]